MNDSLDYNEEVHSNKSNEEFKDIESPPTYFILSYPLGNHKIDKAIFTRLRLGTSIYFEDTFTITLPTPNRYVASMEVVLKSS